MYALDGVGALQEVSYEYCHLAEMSEKICHCHRQARATHPTICAWICPRMDYYFLQVYLNIDIFFSGILGRYTNIQNQRIHPL